MNVNEHLSDFFVKNYLESFYNATNLSASIFFFHCSDYDEGCNVLTLIQCYAARCCSSKHLFRLVRISVRGVLGGLVRCRVVVD